MYIVHILAYIILLSYDYHNIFQQFYNCRHIPRSGQNCFPNLPSEKNPFLALCTKRFGNIIWTEILTVLKNLKYRSSRGAWFLRNSVFQFLFRILGNIKCQIIYSHFIQLCKKSTKIFRYNLNPLPFKDEF